TSQGKQFSIIEVGEGPLTSALWASENAGFVAASKALGAQSKYFGTPSSVTDVQTLLKLIQDGQAMKPDGMIITDDRPTAEDAVIKQVTASGIPVLLWAAGDTSIDKVGAIGYVGLGYTDNGAAGGR